RNSAASSTVLVNGPTTDVSSYFQWSKGAFGIRPNDVFNPNAPVKLAGIRIEPPPSLAVTNGKTHAVSAAAEPPLDPPGVCCRFHGERVTPYTRFLVIAV